MAGRWWMMWLCLSLTCTLLSLTSGVHTRFHDWIDTMVLNLCNQVQQQLASSVEAPVLSAQVSSGCMGDPAWI